MLRLFVLNQLKTWEIGQLVLVKTQVMLKLRGKKPNEPKQTRFQIGENIRHFLCRY
jgi:hypothetical protein